MLIPFHECIVQSGGRPFEGVLHIGAHHGEEAADYHQCGVKKVLWVEANPILMKTLWDKTNMFHGMKQDYENLALSDTDGVRVNLNITNNSQSSSLLPLGTHAEHYPHIKVTNTLEVVTKRFDTFYKEKRAYLDLGSYDFVNLDVQGVELNVLKGFGNLFDKFRNIKAIYTEVNVEEVYKGAALLPEMDVYLNSLGFNRMITKITEYNWGDALYVR
jgi:FkbM family methyltransferase